jgi:hypothetical protein
MLVVNIKVITTKTYNFKELSHMPYLNILMEYFTSFGVPNTLNNAFSFCQYRYLFSPLRFLFCKSYLFMLYLADGLRIIGFVCYHVTYVS